MIIYLLYNIRSLCEADTGLFTAANLSFLVPGGNLTELITNTIDFDEVIYSFVVGGACGE